MIGSLDLKPGSSEKILIAGGGVSGLLAAYRLVKAGHHVELFEATDRLGGMIKTVKHTRGLSEAAANSILANGAVKALFDELKIDWIPVHPKSKSRWIYRNGKGRKMPLSFGGMTTALKKVLFGKTREAQNLLDQETLASWGERQVGREVVDYLLNPFVRGIYGSRPSEIVVSAAFKILKANEGKSFFESLKLNRARINQPREKSVMCAPRAGIQALTDALIAYLQSHPNFKAHLNRPFTADLLSAERVLLCTSPHVTAQLLGTHDLASSQALASIRMSPLMSVTVFAKHESFKKIPNGVGLLVPEIEASTDINSRTKPRTLGALFSSSSFEGRLKNPSEDLSLTIMIGGTSFPQALDLTEPQIEQMIREDLELYLTLLPGADLEFLHHRWLKAIPIYGRELVVAQDRLSEGWCARPGHAVFSNYTGEVSVRGLIDTSRLVTGTAPAQPPNG
jgi:oxygen-dependent protoporphyrinogen oxidase